MKPKELLRSQLKKRVCVFGGGMFAGFLFPKQETFNCILVGLKDGDAPPSPELMVLVIADKGGMIYFGIENESAIVPFGGGWSPMEELQKFLHKIPDLS